MARSAKKTKPRLSRRLPPHQYCLRLSLPPDPKVVEMEMIRAAKPHLVYFNNSWHLFRNKWKSQFRGYPLAAATVSHLTIPLLKARLARVHDRCSFGYQG